MKFDIYGRFEIEVVWENDHWVAFRAGNGLRQKVESLVIPDDIPADEIAKYLDDLYHESAQPGDAIKALD